MDWKLEVIVVPVSDIDRAKAFYLDRAGFRLDVDHRAGEHFRIVQLTPPGSHCSITLMREPGRAGSLTGLHLIVEDIEAAVAELAERRLDVDGPFHFEEGRQAPGPGIGFDCRGWWVASGPWPDSTGCSSSSRSCSRSWFGASCGRWTGRSSSSSSRRPTPAVRPRSRAGTAGLTARAAPVAVPSPPSL